MKKIGVFCSASEQIDSRYFDTAASVGRWLGETGRTLVYGGANLGLMEHMAVAARESGARIIGVVPTLLEEKGKVSSMPDVIIRTHNLSDRKDKIIDESDILLALPGGVGTLDEVFHTMGAASIGYHHKQVVLYNQDGFYNHLIAMLSELQSEGFSRCPLKSLFSEVTTMNELKETIEL